MQQYPSPVQENQPTQNRISAQNFLPAVILIAIGALFLLSNLHILRVTDVWAYWPVALMIAGAFKLAEAPSPADRATGGLLLVGGGVVLACNLQLIPVDADDLWPLVLIGSGVFMLVNRNSKPWRGRFSFSAELPGEAAIFGGGTRKFATKDFKYAKFDAVFGGFDVDFRQADIAGDSATIEVNAVFGGAEIRIPPHWSVELQGTGVFGGYSDESVQPNPLTTPNIKRLFCKGSAVFGGINIKN